MEELGRIGLDIAERWFQVHAATADGKAAFSRKLARDNVVCVNRL